MSYRFVNWGSIHDNFWELNPQLPYILPFRELYERDKTANHQTSSKEMWCIAFHEDPRYDNKLYRMPLDNRREAILFYYPQFDFEDPIIKNCISSYDAHCITPAARAFKEEEISLIKRADFIKTAPYTFDEVSKDKNGNPIYTRMGTPIITKGTAKDLDSMRGNTLKIYKQYEEVKKIFDDEQGDTRVLGGRRQTIRERGELMEFDDLVKIEPRLGILFNKASAEKPTTTMDECWWRRWYGWYGHYSYRNEMIKLVGWFSEVENPILRSIAAYELSYKTISDAIPDCRLCVFKGCEDSPKYKPNYEECDG